MATTTINDQHNAKQRATAQLIIEETGCAAALPYWPIWAAAQFTSTDECKGLLQFVRVHHIDGQIQIVSTDGFRAFRFHLPTELAGEPTLWRIPEDGLLLHGKSLRKAVSYACLLTVTDDLRAVFHGGKMTPLTELSSINIAGHYGVHFISDTGKVGTFPNINQLWPQEFSNAPGRPWCFNAALLKDWCAVVEKLSRNGAISFQGNSPTTPFVMEAGYEPCIGDHFEDPKLELLLMPIQVRR